MIKEPKQIKISIHEGYQKLEKAYGLKPGVTYDCIPQDREDGDSSKVIYVHNLKYFIGNTTKIPPYAALTTTDYEVVA